MTDLQLPDGVWPAMITPMHPDKTIVWSVLEQLTNWYIDRGVAGLFAVGLSSEMYQLSDQERLHLAARVVECSAGRVPVVAAGTFGGPLEAQADFIRQMHATGVQAVTVILSCIAAPQDDDTVLRRNLEQLMDLTDDVPLALYECPQPYHRTAPVDVLGWAAKTGRFHLLKETTRSLEAVKAKIKAAQGTPLKVLNADATSLLASLEAGGNGYCGIAANFYPELLVALCAEPQRRDTPLINSMVTALDPIIHQNYPQCAKYFHRHYGVSMSHHSRLGSVEFSPYDLRVLDAIALQLDQFHTG